MCKGRASSKRHQDIRGTTNEDHNSPWNCLHNPGAEHSAHSGNSVYAWEIKVYLTSSQHMNKMR